MADTQTQTNSDFLTPNSNDNVDVGSLLQKLIASVNNSAQNGSGGFNGTSPSNQTSEQILHPVQQAALDGAVSETKKMAAEATRAGGPAAATHIVNQFGGGSPVPGGNGASGSFQMPTGQTQPSSNASTQPSVNQQQPVDVSSVKATPDEGQTPTQYQQANKLLQQQALQEAQPKNWLQRFTDQFNQRTGGITQADRIANMQAMQKIVGGEQLQPKDIATFNSEQWRAGLDATKSSLAAEAQNMSNLVDLHSKLEATKGRPHQLLGWPSDDQNKVVGKINESYDNVGTLIGNIKSFTDNPPKFSGAGVINPQAANLSNKIQSGVDPAAIAEAKKRGLIK